MQKTQDPVLLKQAAHLAIVDAYDMYKEKENSAPISTERQVKKSKFDDDVHLFGRTTCSVLFHWPYRVVV